MERAAAPVDDSPATPVAAAGGEEGDRHVEIALIKAKMINNPRDATRVR